MIIRIQGLKNGLNEFKFNPDSSKISLDNEAIGIVETSVKSSVDKGESNVIVTNDVNVTISVECDTCLEKYETHLKDRYTVFYTNDKKMFDHDEMSRFLSKSTQEIDLTEGLRESILISLPMKFKCSSDCQGLCDQCGANLNAGKCKCEKVSYDPRWEDLKKLFQEKPGVSRLN